MRPGTMTNSFFSNPVRPPDILQQNREPVPSFFDFNCLFFVLLLRSKSPFSAEKQQICHPFCEFAPQNAEENDCIGGSALIY